MKCPWIGLHLFVKFRSADTSCIQWHNSWIIFTFLGAEIQEKWHKTKGEHFPEPQILSFLPWGGSSGLVGRWCWVLSTPRGLEELLEQWGVPSISIRDTGDWEGAKASSCVYLRPGDPQGASPGRRQRFQTSPEQFQAGAAPAPTVLVPSAGPCACSSSGKTGSTAGIDELLKVFSSLNIPWS